MPAHRWLAFGGGSVGIPYAAASGDALAVVVTLVAVVVVGAIGEAEERRPHVGAPAPANPTRASKS